MKRDEIPHDRVASDLNPPRSTIETVGPKTNIITYSHANTDLLNISGTLNSCIATDRAIPAETHAVLRKRIHITVRSERNTRSELE